METYAFIIVLNADLRSLSKNQSIKCPAINGAVLYKRNSLQ